jgi:hypothetical protein
MAPSHLLGPLLCMQMPFPLSGFLLTLSRMQTPLGWRSRDDLLYKSIIRIYHLHSVCRLYTRSARVSVQPKIFDTSQSNKNVLADEMLCNSIKMALSKILVLVSHLYPFALDHPIRPLIYPSSP